MAIIIFMIKLSAKAKSLVERFCVIHMDLFPRRHTIPATHVHLSK